MKKVIVTGAGGFVGKHSLEALLKKGYEVHAVSTKARAAEDVVWHQVDLFDAQKVALLFEKIKPSHLLHFAWIATHGTYWSSLENLRWMAASINITHAFLLNGGHRMTIAGTCAEYDWGHPCTEESNPFSAATLYGKSKRGLYSLLRTLSETLKFDLAWGYLFYLYGPGECSGRFLPSIIQGLREEKQIPCSHGNQIRDFLYVRDAAEGFVELLDSSLIGAFNIASGEGVSLRSLAEMTADLIGKSRSYFNFGAFPSPKNDPPELVADIKKRSRFLSWQPKYSLEQGLRETLNLQTSDI